MGCNNNLLLFKIIKAYKEIMNSSRKANKFIFQFFQIHLLNFQQILIIFNSNSLQINNILIRLKHMLPKSNHRNRYLPHNYTYHSQRYGTPLLQISQTHQNIPPLSLEGTSPTSCRKMPQKQISSMIANINIQDKSKRALEQLQCNRMSRSSALQSKYSKYVSKKLNMVNQEEQPPTNNKSTSNKRLQHKNISMINNFQEQTSEFPGAVSEYEEQFELKDHYGEQIKSILDYIGYARQKKSEIENLLHQEENKAQSLSRHYTEEQLGSSLRKLKKVVRLMEIVCKLILGTETHLVNNSLAHSQSVSSIYQQMGFSTLQSQSMQTYELELKNKDREITRLQKLVDMLSAPDKAENTNKSYEDQYVIRSDVLSKDISIIQNQTKIKQIAIQTDNFVEKQQECLSIDKGKVLEIQHAFSIWNIFDHEESMKLLKKNKSNIGTQTTKSLKLSIDTQTEQMQMQDNGMNMVDEHLYMRRYKSLIKLCSYALNLVIGLCFNSENIESINMKKVSELSKKIHEFAENFNEKYSQSKEEHRYDDKFCQETKKSLQKMYEQLKIVVRL